MPAGSVALNGALEPALAMTEISRSSLPLGVTVGESSEAPLLLK
jgi:hypothetical protein